MPVVGPILNVPAAPCPCAFSVYRISRSANDFAFTDMMLENGKFATKLRRNRGERKRDEEEEEKEKEEINSLGVLLLIFRYLGLVRGHVELRRPFSTYDR